MIWMGRTCCIFDTMAFVRYTVNMLIILKLASHTRREKDKMHTYVRKYHTESLTRKSIVRFKWAVPLSSPLEYVYPLKMASANRRVSKKSSGVQHR